MAGPTYNPLRRESDAPARRQLRKGVYLLPSLLTAGNIAAGYYAVLQTLQGSVAEAWHFDHAAKAIGFAVLFDGLDELAAGAHPAGLAAAFRELTAVLPRPAKVLITCRSEQFPLPSESTPRRRRRASPR